MDSLTVDDLIATLEQLFEKRGVKMIEKDVMYVHKAEPWEDKEYKLFQCDMSEYGYVCLGPVEVSFTPPNIDPVAAELESIEKVITNLRADFQAKLTSLQERADNLLAITYDKENER